MTHTQIKNILFDRGDRRLIKDRRFLVTAKETPERRTGLKRRRGLDRRYKQIHLIKGINRRVGEFHIIKMI
jgi:hypothetical protein